MRLPLLQRCAATQRCQGYPSAATPSLTSLGRCALSSEGQSQKKKNRFFFLFSKGCKRWLIARSFRRMGLGDFVRHLDIQDTSSCHQSAGQMEAPILRRTPFKHLVAFIATSLSADRSSTKPCFFQPFTNRFSEVLSNVST